MAVTQDIRMKNPAHPGAFVKSEIVEALGLSVTRAAEVLGVTRAALSAFLNERSHLSPDMALRIEKAFGTPMDTLMRMQNTFDIVQTRKREGSIHVLPYAGGSGAPVPVTSAP
jgi:addiction module HigA family antidote